ncbi:MAG: bifunctional riboflavin kinase/FAD synthetase [Flavobacteriales bacterium]|nr:bifunctional riboflavin kinase/FAD synthetase [Flavobacteriales bacterium]
MEIINNIFDWKAPAKTILTLGTFDGVHVGHQKIIKKLLKQQEKTPAPTVVLTFFPHPRMVLQQDQTLKLLNTIEERIELLQNLGIDCLVVHPFDYEFSRLTAEEFVEKVLVQHANIQNIIIGYDHRFGRNRTANITDLEQFGKQFGFDVTQISAKEIDEISVSSTKIRNALIEGDIATANTYLGYHYFLTGSVQKGKQLGRSIGFPTANLQLTADYKLVPKNGVYIVQSTLHGKTVYGMMNIGNNPTVDGTQQHLEVHFFDWNNDLYQQTIRVELLHKTREEIKFDSVVNLKKQLELDQQEILQWLKEQKK